MRYFARSFLLGAASLLDFAAALPPQKKLPSDEEALRSDWMAVWNDLQLAYQTVIDESGPEIQEKARQS